MKYLLRNTLAVGALRLMAGPRPASAQFPLFVSDPGSGVVYHVDSSGNIVSFASGFANPAGMVFDKSGALYVSNLVAGTITKISSGGVVTPFVRGLNSPRGITFDAGGNLFVAAVGANDIEKITPSGAVSVFASGFQKQVKRPKKER